MQHGGEAGVAAQFAAAQILDRARRLAQQQVVEDVGLEPTQAAQLVGHGERQEMAQGVTGHRAPAAALVPAQ